MQKLSCAIFIIFAFLYPLTVTASPLDNGVLWLSAQQQVDGGYYGAGDTSSKFQSSYEAAVALNLAAGLSYNPDLLTYISTDPMFNTEWLAKKLVLGMASTPDGSSMVAELLGRQNNDGGFGSLRGYESTVFDTAYALEALATAGLSPSEAVVRADAIARAITFISSRQNADGGYSLKVASESSLYITALASISLQRYQLSFNVGANIEAATAYLLSKQSSSGGWNSIWESAYSLLAIIPVTSDSTRYAAALATLESYQLSEGSWGGKVYETALALRVLALAENVPPPVSTTSGLFTGRVVDSVTGQPIVGANIVATGSSDLEVSTEIDGKFALADVAPGDYLFSYIVGGYVSVDQNASVSAGQHVDLGEVRLSQQSDVGILSGVVTDVITGLPIAGAVIETTGVLTAAANTGSDGHFYMVAPPGSISITVSATGYDSTTAVGNINAGVTLSFSPGLYLAGGSPNDTGVQVSGIVVDADTESALANANIRVLDTSYVTQSGIDGAFQLAGLNSGELVVEISEVDHLTVTANILAPAGSNINLGRLRLPRVMQLQKTTISGKVTDVSTGAPVAGANVQIVGGNIGAVSATDGSYIIENVANLNFTLSTSAVGFLSNSGSVQLSGHGLATVDIKLQPAQTGEISIVDAFIERPAYAAYDEAELHVVFNNANVDDREIVPYVKVVNSEGVIVQQFPGIQPVNSFEAAGVLLLPGGNVHEAEFGWYTEATPPGVYLLVVQAFDKTSGQLLAERGVSIEVETTQAISGHVAFDPPIAQLAANAPIDIDAKLVNKGNVAIPQGALTATVALKNVGYQQRKTGVEIQTLVQGNGLDNPQATDIDSAGNIYVVNKDTKSILKVSPEGQVSEFLNGLHGPTDVDVSPQGDIYVLDANQYFIRIAANGEQEKIQFGLSGARAIEVMADGRIYIAQGNSLYEVASDGTPTKIIGGGLSSPQGMVMDSHGNIFVASSGDHSISKYANGQITTFISDIPQPYGMDIDAEDNLYVVSGGSSALYKVTPAREVSIVADGLKGPRDVKINADGNFIVSNRSSHEIVTITPAGEVSVLVPATIYQPIAVNYDAAGSLYVANRSFANVVKFDGDASVGVVANGVRAVDLLARTDGSLTLLESSLIREQDTSGVLTQLGSTSLSNPTAILTAPSGSGYLVAEAGKHRIAHVSDEGQLSTYSEAAFPSPVAIRQDALGNQYILDYGSNGSITKISSAGEVSLFAESLRYPRDMVLAADGGIYVTQYNSRRVLYVDAGGNTSVYADLDFRPVAIGMTPAGEVLVAPWGGYTVYQLEASGVVEYASVDYPIYNGLVADAEGNLWVAHTYYNRVSKIDSLGQLTVYYVNRSIFGLDTDGLGGVYAAGYRGINRIDSAGVVSAVVDRGYLEGQTLSGIVRGTSGSFSAVNNNGVLFNIDDQGALLKRYSSLNAPRSMAYDDNGDLLIVNANNTVVKLSQPNGIPEIIVDGNYQKILYESPSSLLLTTSTSVKRYDPQTSELSALVSGFSNITGMALDGDGALSVVDYTKNELHSFAADGSETRRLVGLVAPGGLQLDSTGQILVANAYPKGIVKIGSAEHSVLFSTVSSVNHMLLEADGSLLASRSGSVVRLSSTGKQIASYSSNGANDLLRDSSGALLVASSSLHGLLAYADDYSYQLVAAGLSAPDDIETNSLGALYVADNHRGTVGVLTADNGLSLVEPGLTQVESLSFGNSDELFAAYGGNKIRSIDSDGTRAELPVSTLLGSKVKGLATAPGGNLIGLVDSKDLLFRLLLSDQNSDIAAGDVVYSITLPAGDLLPGPDILPLDFGAFIPPVSGDYEVTLIAADGGTAGALTNTLHVGPNAQGGIALAQNRVFPGDRVISGALSIFGADSTSVSRIEADGTTLAASSYTNGRGIAADSSGNIYSSNNSSLVKISPTGEVSEFVSGVSLGNGLAVDNDDNIYAGSGSKILKITQNAQVETFATLGGGVSAVAVDKAGVLYSTDSSGRLSRIHADGTVETITTIGLSNPAALAIDVYGYFYVLNRTVVTNPDGTSGNVINRISPDGKSVSQYYSGATFEFEGVNLTADCSNNLLFAPFFLPEINFSGEERLIVQLVGDTGEVSVVLDGTTIDPALADMDVLFYDRLGDRMLIWTDRAGGKIFSFPVACGGLDLEAHLVTRGDVDLMNTDPAPSSVVDQPDGTKEYIWLLSEVDNRGENIDLNFLFRGLSNAEVRPALQDAYLLFSNSFVPEENVRVPLDIPFVSGSSLMTLDLHLDRSTYGPNEDMPIALEVGNESDLAFDGLIKLAIQDSTSVELMSLPDISVTQLAGFELRPYVSSWLSGDARVGDYKVVAQLYDSSGTKLVEATAPFNVVADLEGNVFTGTTVTTDQAIYNAWDQVLINGRVRNSSANAIMAPSIVEITLSNPDSAVIFTDTAVSGELFPGAYSDFPFSYTLSDGLAGEYLVGIRVLDAATQEVLAVDSVRFAVERAVEQGLVGHVTLAELQLNVGGSNQCTSTVTNVSSIDMPGIVVYQRVYSMDSGDLMSESSWLTDLLAGGSFNQSTNIDTTDYPPGAYACVLQIQVNGGLHNVAAAGFELSQQVNISSDLAQGNGGRILVLIDAPEQAEGTCTSLVSLSASASFEEALPLGTDLLVSVYDAAEQLLDAETVQFGAFTSPHNQNVGASGIELSITGLSDKTLSLVVGGTQADNGHLGDDYRFTIAADGANALALDSGLIHTQCQEARLIGEHFSAFRIDSFVGLDAANDQHGPTGSPSESIQQAFVQRLMDQAGLQYTLVSSADTFESEFYSGGYSAYALLSEQIKLPETVQKLVREAAYRGEGLMVAGDHDQRNHNLYEALGVLYRGKEPRAGGLELLESAVHPATQTSLQLGEAAINVVLSGAISAGHFVIDSAGSTSVPALTYQTYGLGRAVHVGYDLLAEATLAGLDSTHAQLLLSVIDYMLPSSLVPVQGNVVPLTLTLSNEGFATPGRVIFTLPAGLTLIDAGGASVQADGSLIAPFVLQEGEIRRFTLWLQAQTDLATQVEVLVQAGEAPDYFDLENLSFTLTPLVKPALVEALAELVAMESGNRIYSKALNWLEQAESEWNSNTLAAIDSLVKCSDELSKLDTPEAGAVRLKVAEALRLLGFRL